MPRCWLFRMIALARDLLDVRGGQFLDVHQERAVAVNVNHLLVREARP